MGSKRPGLTHEAGTLPATKAPGPAPTIPRHLSRGRSLDQLRRLSRLRLVNDDGAPTAWCALIGIVAPALVVLSIGAIAIVQQ